MAARHGYIPVTPLEDSTNSFVEIASALIHDCLVGIQRGGTAFSNRGTLVSLSIQNADLQEQRCLSRLAELRYQIFDGREVLDQLRHALRRVSEERNRELAWRGYVRRRDFDLRFNEFVWEVRQRLDDPIALRGHQDRVRAFLGMRTRVGVSNGARAGEAALQELISRRAQSASDSRFRFRRPPRPRPRPQNGLNSHLPTRPRRRPSRSEHPPFRVSNLKTPSTATF